MSPSPSPADPVLPLPSKRPSTLRVFAPNQALTLASWPNMGQLEALHYLGFTKGMTVIAGEHVVQVRKIASLICTESVS